MSSRERARLGEERVGAVGSKRFAELALCRAHVAVRQREFDLRVDELFGVDATQVFASNGVHTNDLRTKE